MQTIYLDISNRGVIPAIYAKQGDVGRKVEVILTNSGLPYEPEAGSAFSAWFSGASGVGNYTDIGGQSAFAVSGNKVTVELITQMLQNAGEGILCLVLSRANGDQIGLWNIPYICEGIPGAGSEPAKDYYTAFSQAVAGLPYPDVSLSAPGKAADAAAVGAALKSKAPAGFGLGGNATDITGKNLNDYTKWGVYYWVGTHTNAPFDRGYMEVIPSNGEGVTQVARKVGYVDGTVGIQVQRTMNEWGTWSPWEWVNPPMVPGVEYRTTERWNGKAVYTCLVNCGNVAGDGMTSTYHKLNIVQCISSEACATTGDSIPTRYVVESDISVNAYANKSAVHIYTSGGFSTSATIYAKLRYTKD